MKRRTFLKALAGLAAIPALTYAAVPRNSACLIEGVTPQVPALTRAPTVVAAEGGWPLWQYGDYISANHYLSEQDIADHKFLCRVQAKETFEALQVPDACDKLEYIVHQAKRDEADPLLQRAMVAWKVTIPAPQWQLVLSKHTDPGAYLKQVLKTRKQMIPISLNGNTQMIPRGYVRDYLPRVASAK